MSDQDQRLRLALQLANAILAKKEAQIDRLPEGSAVKIKALQDRLSSSFDPVPEDTLQMVASLLSSRLRSRNDDSPSQEQAPIRAYASEVES